MFVQVEKQLHRVELSLVPEPVDSLGRYPLENKGLL